MSKLKASILAMTVVLGVAVAADAFAQRAGRGGGGGGGGGARHYHHGGGNHHHNGGVSVGLAFGSPFWYGYGAPYYWPYYRPYYYPYPVAAGYPAYAEGYPAYAAGPAAYVEQAQPAPAAPAPAAGYWYYCSDSQGYYPHVQQCAVPWQRVAPQPPS